MRSMTPSGLLGSLLGRSDGSAALEDAIRAYLPRCRWFGGKARGIRSVAVVETIPVRLRSGRAFIAILEVSYGSGERERYLLPLAFASGSFARKLLRRRRDLVVAQPGPGGRLDVILHDAAGSPEFCRCLLEAMARRIRSKGSGGTLVASGTPSLDLLAGRRSRGLAPSLGRAEQSNTTVVFGDRLILKLFRRLSPGENPDLEMGRFFQARRFAGVPPLAGALEYQAAHGGTTTLGILHTFLPGSRDAWSYTMGILGRYYGKIRRLSSARRAAPSSEGSLSELAVGDIPCGLVAVLGTYAEAARLLGRRTAEMHLTLASERRNEAFTPEPFTRGYLRAFSRSLRDLVRRNFRLLESRLDTIPAQVRPHAREVLGLEGKCLRRFHRVLSLPLRSLRIRCHGDFHLGQILRAGSEFYFIDFEGEPARPLGERRIKHSPLRDVAGMVRSFHYAAHNALRVLKEKGRTSAVEMRALEPWARLWYHLARSLYLKAYLESAKVLFAEKDDFWSLLDVHLLEKACYELAYELDNRPDWVEIPLRGILDLLGES